MADLAQFRAQNKFLMLAIDHRDSIKKRFSTDQEIVNFKAEIIASIQDQFSGVLIDVAYGLPAYKNKTKPFLLPVEKSGYQDVHGERVTELEHTVSELKNLGAAGIKLLINFKPDVETSQKQLETAKQVMEDCRKENLPFFLEIIAYDKEKKVIESVEAFLRSNIRPDVFKLEYPGSVEASKKITEMLGSIPWILLTGGEDFALFKLRLRDAVSGGCVGFLAGRALWKELFELHSADKDRFLKEVLPSRFKEISQIVTGS